mmetsp:Transcript_7624/g.8751  ORF Transcript_7624/g.8751 Transcript_7624/m.8751 type:complete len:285 (+) Transcript_7624:308-1162(+)
MGLAKGRMHRQRAIRRIGWIEYLSPMIANMSCGLVSGLAVTGLLNPVDKALYLSITKERSFLLRENFVRPYQGLTQTLIQRSLSTGLYFPLETCFLKVLPTDSPFIAGQAVGMVTGLVLTPLAFVKYQIWGHPDRNRSFLRHCRHILNRGGTVLFFRGTPVTCVRDAIFGATYATFRRGAKDDADSKDTGSFFRNMMAAAAGTALSSPINYVRNMQFSASLHVKTPRIVDICSLLVDDVRNYSDKIVPRVLYLQRRLAIGWGTFRVAFGMAIGSKLYEECQKFT